MINIFILFLSLIFSTGAVAYPPCPSGSATTGTGVVTNLPGCKCTNPAHTWNGSACVGASCPATTLGWNSNCNASVGVTGDGGNVTLTNQAGGFNGSATFTCNSGSWSGASGSSCNPNPTGCAATTLGWANCSANLPAVGNGASVTKANTNGSYSGYASFTCTNGSWSGANNSQCIGCPGTTGMPKHGGPGGSYTNTVTCPGGQFMVAIQGRSGTKVDQLSFGCQGIDPLTLMPTGAITYYYGGGSYGGGNFGPFVCPSQRFLTGFQGRSGTVIDNIGMLCTDYFGNQYHTDTTTGGGGGSYFIDTPCPAGSAISSIYVSYGTYVDYIIPTCTCLSPGSCGPQSVSWGGGSCDGSSNTIPGGGSQTVYDVTDPNGGSANFSCSNGTVSSPSGEKCGPPTTCNFNYDYYGGYYTCPDYSYPADGCPGGISYYCN